MMSFGDSNFENLKIVSGFDIRISDFVTWRTSRLLMIITEANYNQLICGAEHVCGHNGRRFWYALLAT
jgi:hypothetical protein